MKKTKLLVLPLLAAVTMLTACAEAPVNQGPELRGVSDINCLVNTSVDLLDGVSALDTEDGDITPNLQITITPEVKVEDGFAIFPETGEYEVCYEIRDSLGKLARTTAYASVEEREVYMSNVLTNGFSLNTQGGVKVLADGLDGGVYTFKVTGGEIAEDVRLARTYTLLSGAEYTFRYFFNSSLAGKIAAAADGRAFAERNISAGDNVTEFTYSIPGKTTSDGEVSSETVEIELWLGGLEGELELSLAKAETEFLRESGDYKELAENFDFNGKILDRFDGAEGRVETVDGGKGAKVEITDEGDAVWRGGMFINTGIQLSDGDSYLISFDLTSENDSPFEVCIQRSQWGPDEFIETITNPKTDERNSAEVTITDRTKGSLWLYVQSGNRKNTITISNLSVKLKESGLKTETFAINNFSTNNFNGGAGSFNCENGRVVYDIESFGTDWGNNELGTPSFALSGAAGNFVITFKARATQNISAVFAATYAEYWDTFVWKQLKFTTDMQTYSVKCDNKSVEGLYKFVWQFGCADNAVYRNVTVEISDIKICYVSDLEG